MYEFRTTVRYSETDENGRLTMLGLINYLQDTSVMQTESLGVGIEHMAKKSLAWMLAAWQIQVFEMPRMFDEIVVGTWATGFRGLFATRNFRVSRPDGTVLAQADSIWFTYDFERGLPAKIGEDVSGPYLDGHNEPLDMPRTKRKLSVSGDGVAGAPVVVERHHLDTNHHVNNAQYIELAREALPEAVEPRRILVQYRSAAVLGDTIVPVVYGEPGGWAVRLADAEGEDYAIVKLFADAEPTEA